MDPLLTDEQATLVEVARAAFEKAARLRDRWDGVDVDAWPQVAALDLAGATAADLGPVLEEAGYAGIPEPVAETLAVAVPVLRAAGRDVPDRATLALAGQPYVLDADRAEVLLLERDGALEVVRRWTSSRVSSEDRARRLFRVEAEPGDRLPAAALDEARTRAAWATAAVLNGVSRRLLDLSVEHASQREQFGVPIGTFQAVAHQLADAHVALTAARALAASAAPVVDAGGPEAARAASRAKAAAGAAGAEMNTTALQVHAGIGFTWEHDLHLWLKRGKALEAAYGDVRQHRRLLARALLGEPT